MFSCSGCGYKSVKWLGKCPFCGGWETFQEELKRESEGIARERSLPKLSTDIHSEEISRIETADFEFDRILGGGLVRRVVYASCEPERPDIVPGAWFDVRPGDDALEVARTLGDPVAEVVIGNRVPARDGAP